MGVKANQLMTRNVITVPPEMAVRDLAALLNQRGISGVPVVGPEQQLLGIVSKRDLIARVARPHLPPHIELLGGIIYLENPLEMKDEIRKMFGLTAADIMTRKVIAVDEETDLDEVARLMVEKKINRVPVTHGKVVVGIITRDDIIRYYWQFPESKGPPAGAASQLLGNEPPGGAPS